MRHRQHGTVQPNRQPHLVDQCGSHSGVHAARQRANHVVSGAHLHHQEGAACEQNAAGAAAPLRCQRDTQRSAFCEQTSADICGSTTPRPGCTSRSSAGPALQARLRLPACCPYFHPLTCRLIFSISSFSTSSIFQSPVSLAMSYRKWRMVSAPRSLHARERARRRSVVGVVR